MQGSITNSEQLRITQVIELEQTDGKTRSWHFPTDEQIINEATRRPELPLYVIRFIRFVAGVPPEYGWVNPTDLQKVTERTGVQKMAYRRWLEVSEKEQAAGSRDRHGGS